MAKQQELFDCLPFPPPENNSSPQRKKVKQTEAKQYEKDSRINDKVPSSLARKLSLATFRQWQQQSVVK
mgnify:CR=1 FL=1